MNRLKIKVCGMREEANIAAVAALEPDYLGFIFHPASPRHVGGVLSDSSIRRLTQQISSVGVFVDSSPDFICKQLDSFTFRLVQLHGNETPEDCRRLKQLKPKIELIKAFALSEAFDFARLNAYEHDCDFFLFDAATAQTFGGTGNAFDWRLLDRYRGARPFFLAGGLGPETVAQALALKDRLPNLYALDFNSKLEQSPGVKSVRLVQQIINEVRR